jgi:hypothetical protein
MLMVGGLTGVASPAFAAGTLALPVEIQSLDGSGNNVAHPEWGQVGRPYSRVAPAVYADGRSAMAPNVNSRLVSNRGINDVGQNTFSENGVTQWGWTWGQFLDHTFGLAAGGTESANIPFNRSDPLETFTNDLGLVPFTRDAAAPGTGVTNAREQINTVNSYISAWAVYGGTNDRLEWMRDGPLDGDMANNAATLLLPGGYLPTASARGNPNAAPTMAVDGRLISHPQDRDIAGDVRANENIALTATHTLFAREHNRIVGLLPAGLSADEKFQIARRVVIAEQQYVTYNEFLPAMGVRLPAYTGYKPTVNTTLSNEFATVGYRAHSQIHGEFEFEVPANRYTAAQLDLFESLGVEHDLTPDGTQRKMAVPLNVAFFNPGLLPQLGEGEFLGSLQGEPQYKNDEQIDNHLRSVLFQIPKAGQTTCIEPVDAACFNGVVDLGAIDIERGRDHGIPNYNALRQAYGLAPKTSFAAISGGSESFPVDPQLSRGNEVNDPNSLDVLGLFDKNGAPVALDSPAATTDPITENRRTSVAARLKATYGTVDKVDAFMGMIAEPHLPGSEFGELQAAIWARQFTALRDGDRFFYGNDPSLTAIRNLTGIDFRRTLGQIIASNTDTPAADIRPNVFVVPRAEPLEPGRILAQGSNKCLDTLNAGTGSGVPVEIFTCDTTAAGQDSQKWTQGPNRSVQVFSESTAPKCLDVRDRGTANGTAVQIWTCTGATNQQWIFQANGQLRNVGSNRCLDVPIEGNNRDQTLLQIWDCSQGPTPQQRLIR